MAEISNTQQQAFEHQINTGVTLLPAIWTWNADNSSHVANDALTAIEEIVGAARADGYTTKAVRLRLAFTVTSGTPAPKETVMFLMSKASYPADTPAVSTPQSIAAADAPYILGTIAIATADWIIYDNVAIVEKTIAIPCINQDSTPGTSVYAFLLNTTTTWTPPASSKFEAMLWFELN